MITAQDRKQYVGYTDGAILGIKLIGGLSNEVLKILLDEIRHPKENGCGYLSAIEMLLTAGDKKTNPSWSIARILDECYYRDLISDYEHDYLSE